MAKVTAEDVRKYVSDLRRATERLNAAVDAYEEALNDAEKASILKGKIGK